MKPIAIQLLEKNNSLTLMEIPLKVQSTPGAMPASVKMQRQASPISDCAIMILRISRWATPDPAGIEGGPNLYTYVY